MHLAERGIKILGFNWGENSSNSKSLALIYWSTSETRLLSSILPIDRFLPNGIGSRNNNKESNWINLASSKVPHYPYEGKLDSEVKGPCPWPSIHPTQPQIW